ncbi:MAG: response regulator transcription factor [Bacilli bacterium]|jgi:two-component system KDP operon response regulator KdpE|nr:response regulator transcription factor [Bacilli bacterium]
MDEKILLVEDDPAIVRFLKLALKTGHYDVDSATTGIMGINHFLSDKPDIVLLDLGLPDIDGMEVLHQIREIGKTPIIILSARDREIEKVDALDKGADDYVTKPFTVGELMARIRVCLRKSDSYVETPDSFVFKSLTIDFVKRKVFIGESEIHLTPIEYKIITLLVKNQGKVLTHAYIQNEIWGYPSDDDYQSLRVFMASIRRKIESDTNNPQYIKTEVGVGYRFLEE